jgi:hypothetical protein
LSGTITVFVTTAISSANEPAPVKGLFDPIGDHSRNRSTAEHRWAVIDFDFATGKVRWERELHRAAPPTAKQMKNSYASETPVTDGERVYVYFGAIGLVAALDFNGTGALAEGCRRHRGTSGLGHRTVAARVQGSPVCGQRQPDEFLPSPLRYEDRQRSLENRPRGRWRTGRRPVVWEHETRTEIRHGSEGEGPFVSD